MTTLEDIKIRLDKIIKLLELRNSIERARDQMKQGTIPFYDSEVFPDHQWWTEMPNVSDTNMCNCGQLTANASCPVHGKL